MNRRLRMWMLALMMTLLVAGCGESEPEAPAADAYTVRGEVTAMSLDAQPALLSIHHEAIPEFRDVMGRQTGMEAMTMSFALDNADMADDIATGDKVRMTFEMRPQSAHPLVITRLEELPAETELDFGTGGTSHEGHDHGDHAGHDH